jgi:hypothetical protein
MKYITLEGGIKAGIFKIPPPGFDPFVAKATELRLYGFPPMPDEPHHLARYRRVFHHLKRKLLFVEPAFQVNPDRFHGPRKPKVITNTQTSSGWSGAVVRRPQGESFRWIEGDFTIPNVDAPTDGSFYSATWIGIDGDPGIQVLQAGVACDVSRSGSSVQSSFYLWWEWFPNPEVGIKNIQVSPGDMISLVVCSTQGQGSVEGTVFLANRTTGIGTSVALAAPPNLTLLGRSAEWIVEAPTVDGRQAKLADYGEVFFSECEAVTSSGDLIDGGSGDNINMVDGTLSLISTGELITRNVVRCRYVGVFPV